MQFSQFVPPSSSPVRLQVCSLRLRLCCSPTKRFISAMLSVLKRNTVKEKERGKILFLKKKKRKEIYLVLSLLFLTSFSGSQCTQHRIQTHQCGTKASRGGPLPLTSSSSLAWLIYSVQSERPTTPECAHCIRQPGPPL